jgi:alginate O-acetyltransferase complex protein AlgI
MLFNSVSFAIFLPIVFILYWFVFNKSIRQQNLLLFIASYLFYGWWDWRFLILLAISTIADFIIGLQTHKKENDKHRKNLFILSLCINLGLLCFFKYFNFFVDSFIDAFAAVGIHIESRTLRIILPVGISFYTFQSITYTYAVYKKQITPTNDIISFFAYVSFFPQLVAGPIERAPHFLPQFLTKRVFDSEKARDGLRQILWGLFKKVVIADNCANYVNEIFTNYSDLSGSTLLLGGFLFTIQIYGDFSGYSDIAIGTARLFGFDLMRNFSFPYFSRNIAEFWRRWHISLSTWFRDYVYIPLGGSRGSKWQSIRNVLILFIISGFWHGANWTFLAWGLIHGLYFLPLLLLGKTKQYQEVIAKNKIFPNVKEIIQMLSTFFLVLVAWIFFRATTLEYAFSYLKKMFTDLLNKSALISTYNYVYYQEISPYLIIIFLFMSTEWIQREKQHALELNKNIVPKYLRWIYYHSIFLLIIYYKGSEQDFIYFQF